MKLCLNCIVKNESARIERMLKSVAPYISSYVIVDTGSTDDTKEKITAFFKDAGIPGDVYDAPFVDWSQARNAALVFAQSRAHFYKPDYYLLADADMELVVTDPVRFHDHEWEFGASFEMYQHAGAVHYANTRLVSSAVPARYKGVTHEYLNVPSSGRIPKDVAYFIDHADGANRPDKFKRDIRLLKQGLKEEPNNERYFYYLASSYRDAGKPVEAAKWFKRRVEAGGWDEERWSAQVGYANALKDTGDVNGFIGETMKAYSMRPTRAEAMYDLARYLREHDQPVPALAAAEAVQHLPKPDDVLFVNDFTYQVGVKEEIAITSFYVPGKFEQGARVNDELSMMPGPYWGPVNGARANAYHYVRPLAEACPTFKWQNINFTPPDDLVPLNPSVCQYQGRILTTVRAVNYRIDADGRYVIKGTDGTANAENPIDTRNFILDLGTEPLRPEPLSAGECLRYTDMPVEWPLVTGFEDLRLIPREDELWSSATVRQLHADGNCEQVLTRLMSVGSTDYCHAGMKRMLRQPRETEKNWAPILWKGGLFMHRPGHVVNSDGNDVIKQKQNIAVDNISGSSQVLPWGDGWIAITHTAHTLPGSHKRYYHHRFIEYTADFRVRRVTLPFYFHDRVIEFCAGMCWSISGDDLVISYGFQDEAARIAMVSADEVRRFLEKGRSYA